MRAFGVAVWLLLASMALNGALTWAWLDSRDTAATAQTNFDHAKTALDKCSEGTDKLQKLADKRLREAKSAKAMAAKAAESHRKRADAILSAPPAVPGDDCASARFRADGWLAGRTLP